MDFIKQYKWEIIGLMVASIFLLTPIKSHLKRIFSIATEIKVDEKKQIVAQNSWSIEFSGYKNENITLHDLKGKVIFLHFWGTWCPDCRLEMPEIEKFYQKNKSKVSFIMVAVEKGNADEKLEIFFKENPYYTFPVYKEFGKLNLQLQPEQYPTTFIIDKKGIIVAKKIGATKWSSPEIQKMIDSLN